MSGLYLCMRLMKRKQTTSLAEKREERERDGGTDGREKMERARVRNVNKAFWETFIIARQARTRYDDLIKVSGFTFRYHCV